MHFSLFAGDIVISGISAKFPDSKNMEIFQGKLLNGEDMVTEERPRWEPGFLGLPTRNGRLVELDKFDAKFFGILAKQAQSMDPQQRMLLELTHEAILDAGMNPTELRGTRTGVFIGVSGSDSEAFLSAHPDFINGYVSPGHHRSMTANRISYNFDLHGPSFPVDTACSSSMIALETAVNYIRLGKCDSAIVGGSNLILDPFASMHNHKLGMLSDDGKCKSFDASGDGYVRSEGIGVVLLQKKSMARREYLTILNIRSNTDGYKANGLTFPSGKIQKTLLDETYYEVKVDPSSVEYFETHGTGTKAGDPQELNSVAEVFCNGKSERKPLLIGSVKSNVGHLEPVAGLASIAKMIVAARTGLIPGNLHYKTPNPEIPGLIDGSLKVVTKNTKWGRGIFGINSFGWGGANVHGIFKPGEEFARIERDSRNAIPLIVPFSGRTAESVTFGLGKLAEIQRKSDAVCLIHEINKSNIPGHPFRGFAIMENNAIGEISVKETHEVKDRPIWFVFSGMGSQSSVGQLMDFDPFRESMEKSARILSTLGYDNLLTKLNSLTFDSVTDSFVNIVSTQVALFDTLRSLGLKAHGIIGHSVGEVSCAYADGCMSHEETLELAYWRGVSLMKSLKDCVLGSMAAVGIDWEAIKNHCPADIFPACYNTKDSVTLSGPIHSIQFYVETLKSEGIFAREVSTNGFAFHSQYIFPAAAELKKILTTTNGKLASILANPKPRSSKWITTSVHNDLSDLAKNCSVDYHVNNLISPVYFAQALERIPEDAIVIELAPHALLQALLRRALPSGCTRVGLTKKDAANPLRHFLESVGAVYLTGIPLNFGKLYKQVNFPVSVDTPMISPLIQWDHSTSWQVGQFKKPYRIAGEGAMNVSLKSEEYRFLEDHVIDGRNICPVTMYLYAVWKTWATLNETSVEKFPVTFEFVEFHRPIILSKEGSLRFFIQILNNSGQFEIEESNSLLATGKIRKLESAMSDISEYQDETGSEAMCQGDIYKELRQRGYEYKSKFQGIRTYSASRGGVAKLTWTNHWVSFLDSALHPFILSYPTRNLDLPAGIIRMDIDPIQIQNLFENNTGVKNSGLPIRIQKSLSCITAPGLNIQEIKMKRANRKPVSQRPALLLDSVFIPYLNKNPINPINGTTALLDIVLDNSNKLVLEYVEFAPSPPEALVNHFKEIDSFRVEYVVKKTIYKETNWQDEEWAKGRRQEGAVIFETDTFLEVPKGLNSGQDVVVIHDERILKVVEPLIASRGFVIIMSSSPGQVSDLEVNNLKVTSVQNFNGKTAYLLRKMNHDTYGIPSEDHIIIPINTLTYDWFEDLQRVMRSAAEDLSVKIYLTAQPQEFETGIVGLAKCLRKEPGGASVRYISSQYQEFKFESDILQQFLSLDLVHNVINSEGIHGFFLHRELPKVEPILATEFFLDMLTGGDPKTFNWISSSPYSTFALPEPIKTLKVYSASINLTQLMDASHQISLGPMSDISEFLTEFSGMDDQGRRVIGISCNSAISNSIRLGSGAFTVELPDGMSFEDGTTLPLAYLAAIYALFIRAHLAEKETLLITNWNTPVGHAAIHLANSKHCSILLCCPDEKNCSLLKSTFPFIPSANIWIMGSRYFRSDTRRADTMLNLKGPITLKDVSFALSSRGRLIDFTPATHYSMFQNSISIDRFAEADFHSLLFKPNSIHSKIANEFQNLLFSGSLKPLPARIYDKVDIQRAIGSLNPQDDEQNKTIIRFCTESNEFAPPLDQMRAFPQTYFHPGKIYILVGGLGETGLEVVNWMITRGGRNFVLCNRSGIRNSYQRYHLNNWSSAGIKVICPSTDVTNYEDVQNVFETAKNLGPIGGIFNLSMILRDRFIESMRIEDFEIAVKPKVLGTINLDKASREFCGAELDYFVVFSSITSARGNFGQTNYGFGNSMTERLVEKRLSEGLPGVAIQFGPIGDVRYVEYEMDGSEDKTIVGTNPQRIRSVLSALDKLLQGAGGIKASVVIADKQKHRNKSGKRSLLESLAEILGVSDTDKLDITSNLNQLGMDSLMSVEIKQLMETEFGILVQIQQLRTSSFEKLLQMDKH